MMEMLEMHCIFFLEGLWERVGSAWPPRPRPPRGTRWHQAPTQQEGVMPQHLGVHRGCAERGWWVGSPTTNHPPTLGHHTHLPGVVSPTTQG